MKGPKGYIDLGTIFDEIFEAAKDFTDEIRKNFQGEQCGEADRGKHQGNHSWAFNDNTDYYPNYFYPPMNVFMTYDRSLVFEFALAGFEENDISLSFQGDYMLFSASVPRYAGARDGGFPGFPEGAIPDENVRYLKRRLKLKAIERQKYYVPLDKYAQDKVKAVFRNGILRVTIPPKKEPDQTEGVKIEIVTDTP